MEYRKLGNIDISVIGLGTATTFDVTSEADIAVRRQIVDNCLANEINLIDTAPLYGRAEEVVGAITDGRRDKFYFATKVLREGKEAGEERIAESFTLLKTDYIDLLQVHNLLDWRTQLATICASLRRIAIGEGSCPNVINCPNQAKSASDGRVPSM